MKREIKKFNFKSVSLSYILQRGNDLNKTPLIFLHGFSGSAKDWIFFLDTLPQDTTAIALDFIGHGNSDVPESLEYYTPNAIALQIKTLLELLNLEKVILIGYSMGGRAALSFTHAFPQNVAGMVLESASFGIKEEKERKERAEKDNELADLILLKGLKTFFDYWFELPLFSSLKKLPKEKLLRLKKERLKNNPIGLANTLKYFSTGKMPYFLTNPDVFNFPLLLISGEKDEKYTKQNREISKLLPNCQTVVVPNAGHNVHLEKPQDFINFTNIFLNNIWKKNEI